MKQWLSKCSPRSGSVGIPWELFGNADYWTPLLHLLNQKVCGGQAVRVSTSPMDNSDARWNLGTSGYWKSQTASTVYRLVTMVNLP